MPRASRTLLIVMITLLPVLVLAQQSRTDVTVTGFTYELADSGRYAAVQGITVQAFRNGPLLKNPVVSDSKGKFEFAVPSGDPFEVCFYGADRVPELSQIAGVAGVQNTIHVAMLTVEQAKKREKFRRKLDAKMAYALSALPEGSEAWNATRQTAEFINK